MFSRKIKGFWKDKSNQRACLSQIAKELLVTRIDDWYNVTWEEVVEAGGGMLLYQYSQSIAKVLYRNDLIMFRW